MIPALLLGLQAAAAAPLPEAAGVVPVEFDLAAAARVDRSDLFSTRCQRRAGSDIVVCGRRGGGPGLDMEALDRLYAPRPVVAEVGIGGGATARSYVEAAAGARGEVAKRIMVGVRLPF